MPHGQGYQTRHVSLGASRGVIINRLGRHRNEEGNNKHPRQHPSGRQRISNAQLPNQRRIDEALRRNELMGMSQFFVHEPTYVY